jgi:hypothetical protein
MTTGWRYRLGPRLSSDRHVGCIDFGVYFGVFQRLIWSTSSSEHGSSSSIQRIERAIEGIRAGHGTSL